MLHKYLIILPNGTQSEHEIDWPHHPSYERIRALIEPILGDGEPLEHVAVLYNGRRRDMFVSELGHVPTSRRPSLPHNAAATKIYRHNWLIQRPDLPDIVGIAVLFSESQIWVL